MKEFPSVLRSIVSRPEIEQVVVMNNNPDVVLDPSKLEAMALSQPLDMQWYDASVHRTHMCVSVYNTPTAQSALFLGRFMGCIWSRSEGCYFQDDDWLVHSKGALLQSLADSPTMIHTMTNAKMIKLTRGWRFYDQGLGMNTAFSWFGTGAATSARTTNVFLVRLLQRAASLEVRLMADFFAIVLQNVEPNLIEGDIEELTRENAFSGDEDSREFADGTQRNFWWMRAAVKMLSADLDSQLISSIKRPLMTSLVTSGEPDIAHAGSTRAWTAKNRLSVRVDSNLVSLPRIPTKQLDLSLRMHTFTEDLLQSDLDAGWGYGNYDEEGLGNAVDGDDETVFLARRPCSNKQRVCTRSRFQGWIKARFSAKRARLSLRWCSDNLVLHQFPPSHNGAIVTAQVRFIPDRAASPPPRVGEVLLPDRLMGSKCDIAVTVIDLERASLGVDLQLDLQEGVPGVRIVEISIV